MKGFLLIFVVLFVATVGWRTVFTRKEDREAIRFGVKELAIAFMVSVFGAVGLFFALFNNTIKVI